MFKYLCIDIFCLHGLEQRLHGSIVGAPHGLDTMQLTVIMQKRSCKHRSTGASVDIVERHAYVRNSS